MEQTAGLSDRGRCCPLFLCLVVSMVNTFCGISLHLLVKEGAMRSAAGNRNSVAGMRWRRISNAVVAGTVLVMGAAAGWAQGRPIRKR
jgi:hypothetical protein